jgi:hypothetical protein
VRRPASSIQFLKKARARRRPEKSYPGWVWRSKELRRFVQTMNAVRETQQGTWRNAPGKSQPRQRLSAGVHPPLRGKRPATVKDGVEQPGYLC